MGKPNISIGHGEKPFVNVQKVEIFDCDLGNQLPSFPQRFPHIRTLELNNVYVDMCYIVTPFCHLHDLRFDINKDGLRRFKDNEVADLLRMCHQLQCLHIRVYDRQGLTFNTLLNFIEGNSTIRNLHVNMFVCSMIDKPSEVQKFLQDHPEFDELDFTGFKIPAKNAIVLIQKLNSLKRFRFQLDKSFEYDSFVARLAGSSWQPSMHVDYWTRKIITLDRE